MYRALFSIVLLHGLGCIAADTVLVPDDLDDIPAYCVCLMGEIEANPPSAINMSGYGETRMFSVLHSNARIKLGIEFKTPPLIIFDCTIRMIYDEDSEKYDLVKLKEAYDSIIGAVRSGWKASCQEDGWRCFEKEDSQVDCEEEFIQFLAKMFEVDKSIVCDKNEKLRLKVKKDKLDAVQKIMKLSLPDNADATTSQ